MSLSAWEQMEKGLWLQGSLSADTEGTKGVAFILHKAEDGRPERTALFSEESCCITARCWVAPALVLRGDLKERGAASE